MNFFKKIKELFGKKREAVTPMPDPPPFVQPPVKTLRSESIPLNKKDKTNNRIKAWQRKPFKKKAHRIPFAKWAEPEKYF